jgi:transcription termination factor Rho
MSEETTPSPAAKADAPAAPKRRTRKKVAPKEAATSSAEPKVAAKPKTPAKPKAPAKAKASAEVTSAPAPAAPASAAPVAPSTVVETAAPARSNSESSSQGESRSNQNSDDGRGRRRGRGGRGNRHQNQNYGQDNSGRGGRNNNNNKRRRRRGAGGLPEMEDIQPDLQMPDVVASACGETMMMAEVLQMKTRELTKIAKSLKIEDPDDFRWTELVSAVLEAHYEVGGRIVANCVVDVMPERYGMLRFHHNDYTRSDWDIYVSPSVVRRFNLKTGDSIKGFVRPPKDSEKLWALMKVEAVTGDEPLSNRFKLGFDNLTALYPDERLRLETLPDSMASRIIDLLVPIGKGQRALVVAPPRAGKTVLLQDLARSVATNHPETHLMVLLVDERPEEVTDMVRSVRGEVISSTFDEPASRHVQVAEMVIQKAKRLVEHKQDVVILLDSITRLARAYNQVVPASGKILTGGVDSNALQKPKRFFGAARNIEEGGSLTIIATALIDTGSRMDEVIFEEFKGTGNSEIHLDRKLMEKRIFPCLDINKSATRKEELLMDEVTLNRVWILRQLLHPLNVIDSMEFLLSKLKSTKSNREFLDSMNG